MKFYFIWLVRFIILERNECITFLRSMVLEIFPTLRRDKTFGFKFHLALWTPWYHISGRKQNVFHVYSVLEINKQYISTNIFSCIQNSIVFICRNEYVNKRWHHHIYCWGCILRAVFNNNLRYWHVLLHQENKVSI